MWLLFQNSSRSNTMIMESMTIENLPTDHMLSGLVKRYSHEPWNWNHRIRWTTMTNIIVPIITSGARASQQYSGSSDTHTQTFSFICIYIFINKRFWSVDYFLSSAYEECIVICLLQFKLQWRQKHTEKLLENAPNRVSFL